MATFNKVNSWAQNLGTGVHDLSSDQIKVALTNTAPVATNTVYANLTSPLATTNLSGANPFNVTTTSFTNTSGTSTLVLADLVLTATGAVGPFRYVAVYNDTATNDELIGWIDYGSSISLADTETFTIDFNVATLTIA
jgi:hypothetical protein